MIELGLDVNMGGMPKSALHQACSWDYPELVRLLLENGAEMNKPDERGRCTPLKQACLMDRLEVVRVLLDYGVDVEGQDEFGNTALMITYCSPSISRLLLERGANLNWRNKGGHTALMFHYENAELVELLLDMGAAVNERNKAGATVLAYAATVGAKESVTLLLDRGADVHAQDNVSDPAGVTVRGICPLHSGPHTGKTPLHRAAEGNFVDIAELLVARGAVLNHRDKNGKTALAYARSQKMKTLFASLGGDQNTGVLFLIFRMFSYLTKAVNRKIWLLCASWGQGNP
eukprot:gene856-955_t